MRKYIYHFDTEADFNEMRSAENYNEPWVSLTENVERIDFNKTEEEKERERLIEMPLTFEIQSDGEIVWKTTNTGYTKTIEYSKDNGETWTNITSAAGNTAPSISVVSGDTVQFRGNNANYGTGSPSYYNCFSGSTAQFSVKGNIMSLINSTDFKDISTISSTYCFSYLFYNCIGLTVASKLLLPATTLSERCYNHMFDGCNSLVQSPDLPAETLAQSCYYQMFYNCTSLTTAPALPATTLASGCYYGMFFGCTGLTTAPELPATTLATLCYGYMFQGCTSLTTAPELPATTLAPSCYYGMFRSCGRLTTAPTLSATALTSECYSLMFAGCNSLTGAPELPATILAEGCYQSMFNRCTSLEQGPSSIGTFATTMMPASACSAMFSGCTSLAQAPELPVTTLANYCYQYMFSGCRNLNYIKCLATDISVTNCTRSWVNGVASTGRFECPSTTDWSSKTGNDGIPTNWTRVDAS